MTVTYAGGWKYTNGQGATLGFIDQSANGVGTYTGGTLSYPQGSPQQGVFTFSTPSGPVSFPLVTGSNSFGPGGTSGPNGTFTGTSYLNSDGTFFYAEGTPTQSPSERSFVFGGQPVSASFYAAPTTTQITAFAVQPEAATGSPIPFTLPQFGGNLSNPTVSPFYVVAAPGYSFGGYNATTNPNSTSPRFLQANLAINGQGASQNSVFTVSTGDFVTSNAGNVYTNGVMRGSFLPSGASGPTRLNSSVASVADGNGNAFYGGTTIEGFVLDQNDNTSTGSSPLLAAAAPFGRSTTDYSFTQPVVASTLPSGIGSSRTTQTLLGGFAGIMYSDATSPYILQGVGSGTTPGGVTIGTSATNNRVSATFSGSDQYTVGTSSISSMVLQFGGLTATADGTRSAFIDNNTFAATDSASTASKVNGNNVPIETAGNPGTRIGLVTSSVVPTGFTPCSCQYLQWGYWTGEIDQAVGNELTRYDRAGINTWVAGIPTVTMPATGTGTYNGGAIGSVYNNGASYVATGNFTGTYNFGGKTGSVAISNFDGRNYTATIFGGGTTMANMGNTPNTFTGYDLVQTGGTYTGGVVGNFYGPGAAEIGGYFSIRSPSPPSYMAAGILAGKQ